MQSYYSKNNMFQEFASRGVAHSNAAMNGQQSLLGETMIRTIDELMQSANPMAQPKLAACLGITNAGITGEDQFYGWAPDVQILTENDLKKIEKQEERKARYDKRKR